MAVANIERRGWKPNRVRDSQHIAGKKFGMLTAIEHVGFAKSMAVWRFRCDCGNEVERRSSHVIHALSHPDTGRQFLLHCGCQSRQKPPEGIDVWTELWESLCPEWQDSFERFAAECVSQRSGKRLHRRDAAKPYGPGNFYWSDRHRHRNRAEAVAILVSKGVSVEEAERWVDSVSRQRVSQLIHRANGLCPFCGNVMGPTKNGSKIRVSKCGECARRNA